MRISDWLDKFKEAWENKDLQAVLSLFSDDVEYLETPFVRLNTKPEILDEWQGVLSQEDIVINFALFVESEQKGSVLWELSYKKDETRHNYKGVYLIRLNPEGLCNYFYQTCEERKE